MYNHLTANQRMANCVRHFLEKTYCPEAYSINFYNCHMESGIKSFCVWPYFIIFSSAWNSLVGSCLTYKLQNRQEMPISDNEFSFYIMSVIF